MMMIMCQTSELWPASTLMWPCPRLQISLPSISVKLKIIIRILAASLRLWVASYATILCEDSLPACIMSHTGPQYQTNPNKLLLNAKGLIMCWNFIFHGLKSVWKLTTQTKALCLQMIFSAARIHKCCSNVITCWGNSWQKVCVRTILTVFRSHKNEDQFTGYLLVFEQGNIAKVINASASVKTVFLHLGKSLLMQLGVILIINYLGECTVVFNMTHHQPPPSNISRQTPPEQRGCSNSSDWDQDYDWTNM